MFWYTWVMNEIPSDIFPAQSDKESTEKQQDLLLTLLHDSHGDFMYYMWDEEAFKKYIEIVESLSSESTVGKLLESFQELSID